MRIPAGVLIALCSALPALVAGGLQASETSALVAGGRQASGQASGTGGALSGDLRAHVQAESFGLVSSIRGLPLGVRDGLQALWASGSLDIADPGAEFQAGDVVVNPRLPSRRLIAAGCSADHCLVYYERGGAARSWRVTLFSWKPTETNFEWGASAPAGLKTIDDVRKGVLSGAIKGEATAW